MYQTTLILCLKFLPGTIIMTICLSLLIQVQRPLGINWNLKNDTLNLSNSSFELGGVITKRVLLSGASMTLMVRLFMTLAMNNIRETVQLVEKNNVISENMAPGSLTLRRNLLNTRVQLKETAIEI